MLFLFVFKKTFSLLLLLVEACKHLANLLSKDSGVVTLKHSPVVARAARLWDVLCGVGDLLTCCVTDICAEELAAMWKVPEDGVGPVPALADGADVGRGELLEGLAGPALLEGDEAAAEALGEVCEDGACLQRTWRR